ncbi:GRAM domain-containing protein 3-like isoform X2 [Sinocyclocheilus anshuiensis]|uniref:GRAM domain-containing protein 3-like isoform X2 n=1 Tax=Sinocyclocheilus anshuiensis TaxID=1608454 RepID=UPI0007BAD7B7|nr:PREDICTED: GRAM domain-containing protein 3-like isoform X2 [Sinocyclocheilus anshuiensis]
MLENKRERFKTFLRKIDESAISRIKHLMKESYAADAGTIPAKVKKGRMKSKLGSRKGFSLEENQLEVQQQTKSLSRQVLHRPLERSESLNSRSSFMKHNKTFHKLFPEVPETEDLLHAYVCALQKEVPYHGRLYVTDSSLCFFSSVLLKDTKLVVPVASVSVLKKQNTALLVPNAVSIRTTDGEKYLFVSLRNREGCYKLLRSVCPQLEDGSANSSPLFSSAESSFDQAKPLVSERSAFSCEPASLQQNSSHSSLDERDEVSPQIQLSASPLASENTAIKSPSATRGSPQTADESSGDEDTGSSWVWSVTDRVQSLLIQREVSNLNTLLLIYLILVFLLLLSSGYIGLRIVALEEQLTSLGALPEFTLQSGYKET